MELTNEICRAIVAGKAILFLGAGFSMEAKDVHRQKLPSGGALAKLIIEALGETPQPDESLVEAADYFLSHNSGGRSALVDLLRRTFKVCEWESWQESIACLPWKRIYTTNYDDLVERCRSFRNLKTKSVTPEDPDDQLRKTSYLCVHINGFIDQMNEARTLDIMF